MLRNHLQCFTIASDQPQQLTRTGDAKLVLANAVASRRWWNRSAALENQLPIRQRREAHVMRLFQTLPQPSQNRWSLVALIANLMSRRDQKQSASHQKPPVAFPSLEVEQPSLAR
jgi:hypothetical protein